MTEAWRPDRGRHLTRLTRAELPLCSGDVGLRFRRAKDRAILAGVYRILSVGSDFHEICDECGFHGGTLDLSAAVSRLRTLPDRWSEVMSQDEEQLRARPEPDTWCAVEYAQHVLNAIASIEWGARVFAAGRSPDWDELSEDSLPGVFEHDTHDCDRFDIAATLELLGAAARSMATFAESLTP